MKKTSIIIPSFNGKKYLKSLFESLRRQTHKDLEIIMVDNASVDGSTEHVAKNFPEVKIVKNKKNLGFAGGNNSALPFCGGEYVALINNDMIADECWLERMHGAMEKNSADAVGPKILFYKPFINLRFKIKNFIPSENSLGDDIRELGCKVSSDIGIEGVSYKKTIFWTNTFGKEKDKNGFFHWVSDGAVIKVPVDLDLGKFILKAKLSVSGFQRKEKLKIFVGDKIIFDNAINSKFADYEIEIDKKIIEDSCHYIVNNAGSEFDPRTGIGKDIGIFEDDNGRYNEPKEAFSLCGGSMLIKRDIIDKYGLFDEYFFAYYEDTDFCWRLKKKKKKFFYEPKAVVYHAHAGTSKEWSPFFRYHVERNRLAMLLKNGRLGNFWREFYLFLKKTLRERDEKVRKINFKVIIDLFLHLPVLYRRRWEIRRIK